MQQVTVIGAGTMGHGIAHVAALSGYEVRLFDALPGAAERGLAAIHGNLHAGVAKGKVAADVAAAALSLLHASSAFDDAVRGADLVIEAVPERLDLKQQVLAEAAGLAPDAWLGSNTSSLSIAAIAAALPHPSRLLGTHFFNPVHLMPLLELVRGPSTSDEAMQALTTFGARIGKEVIVVRDSPGFATSRLGVALGMEAIRMLEEGVASAEDIDKAMVLGYRHPIGPLRLGDLVGLDVRLAIGTYLAQELNNPAFSPPALLRHMVAEGKLGKKSGSGFYSW